MSLFMIKQSNLHIDYNYCIFTSCWSCITRLMLWTNQSQVETVLEIMLQPRQQQPLTSKGSLRNKFVQRTLTLVPKSLYDSYHDKTVQFAHRQHSSYFLTSSWSCIALLMLCISQNQLQTVFGVIIQPIKGSFYFKRVFM